MSIIKHVTLQKIVAHDFPYDPREILSSVHPKNRHKDFLSLISVFANATAPIPATHFTFNNFPHPPENRAVYKMVWKNMSDPDRPQMII